MSNLSIWEKESYYAPQDIIIVGAGLMGLWSAWELKKNNEKLRITIIERSTTPLGASTRNAGFACFGSPTELIHDAQTMGMDTMLSIVDMRYRGIEKIKKHFSHSLIQFDQCGGYECINKDYANWETLDEKIEWLNKILKDITGKDNIFKESKSKLNSFGLHGFDTMIENPSEAALHSGHLIKELTHKVQTAGVQILYGLEIIDYSKKDTQFCIQTKQQIDLIATQLLFCTNAFTQSLIPELPITPARGQVIVTSPIDNLLMKGTFHFDEGFYYWRNLGNRILIGGARNIDIASEATTDLSGSLIFKDVLEKMLRNHLDAKYSFTIEHHWSGIMGFTDNKEPFCRMVSDNAFAAIACNGMGVALTPVIAEKVAFMMTN